MPNRLAGRVFFGQDGPAVRQAPYEVEVTRAGSPSRVRAARWRDEPSGASCAMVGYLVNAREVASRHGLAVSSDVELAGALFLKAGLAALRDLEGIFTLFLFDGPTGKGFLLQDDLASNLPLYYAATEDEFRFGTSLRWLLRGLRSPRRLNLAACRAYLFQGLVMDANLILNEETLVEGVRKLPPSHAIEIDAARATFAVRPFARALRSMATGEAAGGLMASVDAAVEAHVGLLESPDASLALSGGYDSNYVLHRVSKLVHGRVTAFTLGGKKVNEIPQVQGILEAYPDVTLVSETLDDGIVERLPDIVWRLEGYVFQSGVFLQYALAQLVARTGAPSLIVAEGADQFLDRRYSSKLSQAAERTMAWIVARMAWLTRDRERGLLDLLRAVRLFRGLARTTPPAQAYYATLDFIVKKNGIMLNSFGVEGVYPFLARGLRETGLSLGRRDARGKSLFKSLVRAALGPTISRFIKKTRGSTDVEYLVQSRMASILETLRRSSVVNALFPRRDLDELFRRPDLYWHLLLELLSLDLFDALFISGAYDECFESEGLALPLGHHLGGSAEPWRPRA